MARRVSFFKEKIYHTFIHYCHFQKIPGVKQVGAWYQKFIGVVGTTTEI
jgi:hypothetical protein